MAKNVLFLITKKCFKEINVYKYGCCGTKFKIEMYKFVELNQEL